ncbi:DNA gyrase subunit B [symbiont of Argiope bruennichi]|uniref:DNA gyrase/topoisomerase IV subunit B n=1 Tax=symbiont of Argiope bruennichi TaxID=2810479 RepID=UPI003DA515D5
MEQKKEKKYDEITVNYTDDNIKVLEGLEPVRKRPSMYIGNTGISGLHHLVWEIIDNSVDEVLAGFANVIEVEAFDNNIISVFDNGRGIPVGINEKTKKTTIETIFNFLHSGGKFENNVYKVSGGLHGVGASVVNALSNFVEVYVYRENSIFFQKFENNGKNIFSLKKIGDTNLNGTKVIFQPDFRYFDEEVKINFEIIKERLKQLSFLNKKTKISFYDRIKDSKEIFFYENGIIDYFKEINKNKIAISSIFFKEYLKNNINIEFVIQYFSDSDTNVFSFCNNILTKDGGTHIDSFLNAIYRTIYYYIKSKNLNKNDLTITREDIFSGLNVIFSLKIFNPKYEGQTKFKISNNEIKKPIYDSVSKYFKEFLDADFKNSKAIVDKVLENAQIRTEIKKIKELKFKKEQINSLNLPLKLSDCSLSDNTKTELFLVEGESAGGNAKFARNRHIQAILPLKGKVLNVEKKHLNKILNNEEIINLIKSIGCGIREELDIAKLRYSKIIIMTDADVDGEHIKILLLTFIFKFMKNLIEEGHIYIANPPLFKVTIGKSINYFYSDEELNIFLKENKNKKINIQRYKGLGEMNAKQLWETTMDPEKRILKKIYLSNELETEHLFSQLMGTKVDERKKIIYKNLNLVTNLDI